MVGQLISFPKIKNKHMSSIRPTWPIQVCQPTHRSRLWSALLKWRSMHEQVSLLAKAWIWMFIFVWTYFCDDFWLFHYPWTEYRQYINNRINESQASLASEDGPTKRECNFFYNTITAITAFPDVTPQNSNSKESYHGLFPLEQLLEQKSQTLNAQTSTFRATKVEDGLNYCLKRIHGM